MKVTIEKVHNFNIGDCIYCVVTDHTTGASYFEALGKVIEIDEHEYNCKLLHLLEGEWNLTEFKVYKYHEDNFYNTRVARVQYKGADINDYPEVLL